MSKTINMKNFYVYKIVDENDTILYIGETSDIKNRLHVHTSTQGKFYKRDDIKLIIIHSFKSKKEAFNYQLQLQKKYGFETDVQKLKNNASAGGIAKVESYKKNGKSKRPVKCFEYNTNKFIAEFPSIRNAEKMMNVDNIEKVLNGKYKKVGGYFFEYA